MTTDVTTDASVTTPAGGPSPAGDAVDRLSAELVRHQRLMHVMKTVLSSWSPGNLDWGAWTLLLNLVKDGPRRQGELADVVLLEPSTVSRRVGQLVQLGYIERQADPDDGRAVQLVATDAGRDVFDRVRLRRVEVIRQVFAHWDEDDVETLDRLLSRMNDDLDAYRPLLARTTAADPVPPFPVQES